MESIPRTSGIYKIVCLSTGKIYVGSSVDLYKRWGEHLSNLRSKNHRNSYLQRAWDKYGESAFIFQVVELVMPWSILDREQYWLDKLKSFDRKIGFNIAINAISPSSGLKRSPEARAKMSAAKKGKKQSPELIAKRTANRKGYSLSPEGRAKLSAIAKEREQKSYIVTSPDGIEIPITGLKQFCSEHNLERKNMSAVAVGKQRHHKGWKCRYA